MGEAPGPDSVSVPQVIPFSIPRIEYATNLYTSSGFADAGATLLEKLYVCWDSAVEHGGNGGGRGTVGLGRWDAND